MAKREIPFIRNFNWRILLLRILINAVALFLTAALVPDIYFVNRSLASLLLLALGLGVLNAFVKPILQVLTLRFIFASYGLIVILINTLILYLLAFFFPARFAVDHLIWAFVGGALIGAVGQSARKPAWCDRADHRGPLPLCAYEDQGGAGSRA